MKQLIIGPRLNKDGVTIGGSEVLFENWIEYCNAHGFCVDIIDANKNNYSSKLYALIIIIWRIFIKAKHNDLIFLHGSRNDYFFIAPIACMIAKLFGKPLYLKKFGGDFDHDFTKAPKWKKTGITWAMKKASGLFWETKRLIPFGHLFNSNCIWCPNTRKKTNYRTSPDFLHRPLKYVFIGHVRKEKGISELIKAFRELGSGYELDIYGTLMGYTPEQLDGRYKRVLKSEEVNSVLSKYDVLILPSYREGYPGIIIEAFGVGVPVIASNIGGIPEMIVDGENGILCEAHNVESLIAAIKRIEKMDLSRLSRNALSSFSQYDDEKVNSKIIDTLLAATV